MEPAIKVENLSKSYVLRHQKVSNYSTLRETLTGTLKSLFSNPAGKTSAATKEKFLALNDVSFEVKQGERIGIIGRNGAGKSTLLKVLSRIVEPDRGKITIVGRVASLLEVGTGFHPELTGRENIFLNGSILGMTRAEIKSKFDEIVSFSEIEKFLDTPVKRYSSGMYVRLAFAVAAHLEPEILIVDEVLAVGDAQFQKKCLGKMKDVSAEGRTVLFVSHNMEAVQKLCSSGILLNKGELIAAGGIESIVRKYIENNAESSAYFGIPRPLDADHLPGFAEWVQIEDELGNKLPEVAIGAGWFLRVGFQLNRDLDEFVIGIGIVTMMEVAARTTWSCPSRCVRGKYEAVFKFNDISFASGSYKIIVGLSEQYKTFHYSDNVASVTISDVSTIINDERMVNSVSGLILNQVDVDITRLS